jgi:hypothetical protein
MKKIINFLRSVFSVSPEKQVKIETCDCKNCTCNTTETYKEQEEVQELEKPAETIYIPHLKVVEPAVEEVKEVAPEIAKEEKKKPRKRYYKKKGEGSKKDGSAPKKANKKNKDV